MIEMPARDRELLSHWPVAPATAAALASTADAPLRTAKAPLATPMAMQIANLEYKCVLVSTVASWIAMSSGETSAGPFFAIFSRAMIRAVSTAGGPTSRSSVVTIPDRPPPP